MMKNYLHRSILSLVVVVAVLVQRSSSSEDPCFSAVQMGNSKRTTKEDTGTCGALCDNYIVNGNWYRLDVSNSGARMPETGVDVWHCGTYIPIWLNGAHPTETNPGPTTVGVCAQLRLKGDYCEWKSQINVKWCKDGAVEYFVYQLIKPPYCDMAYCAGSGVNCGDSGSWNDIIQSCTNSTYPTLDQNPTLIGPYISQTANTRDISGRAFTATSFSLKCRLNYVQRQTDDGARYDVVFDTSGGVVYTKTLKSTDAPEVEIGESYLAGHVDQNVLCRATAYWQSAFPKRSPYKNSTSVYIGIKLYVNGVEITGPLSVPEGDKVTVTVQPSFPITTPACLNPDVTPCSPSYSFRVYTSQLYLTTCTVSVANGSTNSFAFAPIADVDMYYPKRIGTFQLIPDITVQEQGSIFSGYTSKKYQVSITDRYWSHCTSSGDPHVSTFYGAYYHIYGVGEYVLVSIPSRKIQVQVSQTPCGSVSCNCGVIARQGNNIIGINNCPSQTSTNFIRYMKDANNPGGYIYSINSNQKAIVLPSGLLILVYIPYVGYISVEVYMYDMNGPANNDLCSNSLTSHNAECGNECERYRVQAINNFFNIGPATHPTCDANALWVPQCDCSSGGTLGSTCPMPDGDVPLLTYSNTCNQPPNSKRKRSVVEDNSPTTFAMPSVVTPPRNVALPASSSNIGTDQARDACNNALTSSKLYALCITKLQMNISVDMQSCILDVQFLGDLDMPPRWLAKQMENRCNIVILSSNSTAKDDDSKTYDNNFCQKGCTAGGTCVQGTCQCSSGYQGSDCSVRRDAVPTIIKLQSPVCDIQSTTSPAGCNSVFISAKDVSDITFMCKITETASGKVLLNPNDRSASVFLGSVTCPLPVLPVSRQLSRNYSLFSYSINVSLSNDGTTYSNSMKFTVYDGLSITCDATGCMLKSGSTMLRGANNGVLTSLFLAFILLVLHELI